MFHDALQCVSRLCSIIACGKRSLTVKINGVARFNAAAAKLRAQSFTLDGEGVVCGPPALTNRAGQGRFAEPPATDDPVARMPPHRRQGAEA